MLSLQAALLNTNRCKILDNLPPQRPASSASPHAEIGASSVDIEFVVGPLPGEPEKEYESREVAYRGLTLPEPVRQLLASGEFEGVAGDALAACLAADRPLANELLRWCNAPLIGSEQPLQDLGQAAEQLGSGELARLAFLLYVRRLFLPDRQVDRYCRAVLWRHSLAVGGAAAMIARTCGVPSPNSAFLAGALHDIGLLASERLHGAAFANLVKHVDELSPMHEVEREQLGWDHAELGGEILRHWGLPRPIVAAARHHHAPEAAIEDRHAEAGVIACVALANHLCSRTGWSSMAVHNLQAPGGGVLQYLGVNAVRLTQIWQRLPHTLRDASSLS